MERNYFLNFPGISYQGMPAINLLTKASLASKFIDSAEMFYDYTIKDGERADIVAFNYYGYSEYDWIIYLFNNITDPSTQWPLTNNDLLKFIIKKYGTYDVAAKKIKYFRNNWINDQRILNSSDYNALPTKLKKFWDFVPGSNTQYKRIKKDYLTTTNYSQSYIVSDNIGFNDNEILTQGLSYCELVSTSDNIITVKNIIGNINMNEKLVGTDTKLSTTPLSTKITNYCIGGGNQQEFELEYAYYDPVSCIDYEEEQNQKKTIIRLLRPEYITSLNQSFSNIL